MTAKAKEWSGVRSPKQPIAEFLAEDLEEGLGLKDYTIDRNHMESKVLFKQSDWQQGIKRAAKLSDSFLTGWLIFLPLLLFGWVFLIVKINQFLYFAIIMEMLLLVWRWKLAPARNHAFPTAEMFMEYRGYLEHGKNIKAHLRDHKWDYLVAVYLLWNAMIIASMIDSVTDPYILTTLNNIIYDRGTFPNSLVDSVIPALLIYGFVTTACGAILTTRYRQRDPTTGTDFPPTAEPCSARRTRHILYGVVTASFVFYFVVGALTGPAFDAFWSPQGGQTNWLWIFDADDPLYHGRWTVMWYYLMLYAGCTFVTLLILFGFTAFEFGALRLMVDKTHETMDPPEPNWEFRGTLDRRDKAHRDMNKARKASLFEIGMTCLAMILGMWVFLYWGGTLIPNEDINDIMNLLGYAVLGLAGIWFIFISHWYHARHDGTYWYPTVKHNFHYAGWDERGMGSWKHYYREVWSHKRGLIAWLVMWCLFCVSLMVFDWERIWNGGDARLEMDFLEDIFPDLNALAVAIVVLMGSLAIVGFIASLQLRKEDTGNSLFWCTFYKGLMAFVVFCHLRWITQMPQIIAQVDLLSTGFLFTLLGIAGIFAVVAILGVIFVFPFMIKFDNLASARSEILFIIANTIILSVLMMFLFHFLVPMTDVSGQVIDYGYPWRMGTEHEVKAYWNDFDVGDLLLEIGGRYIWWGGLQQYLFMSYFLTLWKKVFPKSKGYLLAAGTAVIFGVIHAIDWPLMLCTSIMGCLWAFYWQKSYVDLKTGRVTNGNNLLLWGFVHGFGGSLLGMVLPFGMGVGPFNM
jgi:hypothetical protein